MRRGQGEYLAMSLAIVAMIIVSLLAYQWIAAIQRSGSEVIKRVIEHKEKLLVIWDRSNARLLVVNQWDGSSVLRALVLIYSNYTIAVHKLNESVEIPLAKAIYIDLTGIGISQDNVSTICIVTEYLNMFCNATIPTRYEVLRSRVIIPTLVFSLVPTYIDYPVSMYYSSQGMDAYLYFWFRRLSAWQYDVSVKSETYAPRIYPSKVPIAMKRGFLNAQFDVVSIDIRTPRIDYYALWGECWIRIGSTPIVVVEEGIERSPHYVAVWTGSEWVITKYDAKVYTGTPLLLVVDGLPLYLGVCGSERASLKWANCTAYIAWVGNESAAIAVATSYCYIDSSMIASSSYRTKDGILAMEEIETTRGYFEPPNTGLEIDYVSNLNLVAPPSKGYANLYVFSIEYGGWVYRYNTKVDLLDFGVGEGNAVLMNLTTVNPHIDLLYNRYTGTISELDAESGSILDLAILAVDDNDRYSISFIHPLFIYIDSARRGYGWCEPGNLSIDIEWTSNLSSYPSGSIEQNISVGDDRIFDLGLDIPIAMGTNTFARTTISYRLRQIVELYGYDKSIPIETTFIFVTDIRYDTTAPAQPATSEPKPSPAPPNPSPDQLTCTIQQTPIPTNESPITVDIAISCRTTNGASIKPFLKYLNLEIAVYRADGVLEYEEYANFTYIEPNLARYSFTLNGDAKRYALISIRWNETPIMGAEVRNYVQS